ncbi:MAG: HAD-IIB family hydrolase [Chloroflexota bacterium]
MRYRLAAIDLDGTLLDARNGVSAANAAALHGLAHAGIVIAPATARPYRSALRHFEAAGLEVAAITSAGADVRLAGGEVVHQAAMPAAFAPVIAALCDDAGWAATFATTHNTYRRENEVPAWAAGRTNIVAVTRLADADLSGLLAVLAHVPIDDPRLEELLPWQGSITAHRALAFNGETLLTLTGAGIDKGYGLRALCAALAIAPAEAVAFGDSDVDLPMFAAAGLAVAMGDAAEHVKDHAAMVTANAAEDGFAAAVAWLLGSRQ